MYMHVYSCVRFFTACVSCSQSIPLLFAPFVAGAALRQQFSVEQLEWALLSQLPLTVNAVIGLFADGTSSAAVKKRK